MADATPLLRAALVPLLFCFLFGTQRGIMWLQGAAGGGGHSSLAEQVVETLTTPSADLCAGPSSALVLPVQLQHRDEAEIKSWVFLAFSTFQGSARPPWGHHQLQLRHHGAAVASSAQMAGMGQGGGGGSTPCTCERFELLIHI